MSKKIRMFNWFKKNSAGDDGSVGSPGITRTVASTGVDRRQHLRVRYPLAGLDRLPHVISEKGIIFPADLSLGGMLLRNPPIVKPKVGGKYAFKTVWPAAKLEMQLEAELLRIHGPNWHFKFTSCDNRYAVEFPSTFKAGLSGCRLRQFDSYEIPQGQNIQELWLSENGELVMFQQPDPSEPYTITLSCGAYRVQFDSKEGLLLGTKSAPGKWAYDHGAPQNAVDDVVFMLSNVRNPTLKITKLIGDIITVHFERDKAA
jgi:hypothetical protein